MIAKTLKKNTVTVAINVLHVKKERANPASYSKHNSNREKNVILLMISNGEVRHYLTVKKLAALLRGTMSKYRNYFYCLNCLHYFVRDNKRQSHKKSSLIMPPEDLWQAHYQILSIIFLKEFI